MMSNSMMGGKVWILFDTVFWIILLAGIILLGIRVVQKATAKDRLLVTAILLILIGLISILMTTFFFGNRSFPGGGMMQMMMGRGMTQRGMMEDMMRNMEEIGKKTAFSSNGERIFYTGVNSEGEVIKNSHGMQGAGCAMCHGADARGMRMMMMDIPGIRWDTLIDPKGHVHPDGRRHPPFTEESFKVCVLVGLDPAGNQLNTMMPRWQISKEDLGDLIGYLKNLAGDK